jgi:uncharacterized protein (DUF1499 family)
MNLFGQGVAGLPRPEPLDFQQLVLPSSPNAAFAAPPGFPVQAQLDTPLFPVPPEQLFETMKALAVTFPRTWLLADWPDLKQAQWVERSAMLGFPDIIVAQAVPRESGSGLLLYSRSRYGWSDFGVNRKRVEKWIAGLEMAVR